MNLFGLGRTKKCNKTFLSLCLKFNKKRRKIFLLCFGVFFLLWVDEHPLLSSFFSQNNGGSKGISVIYYTCISPLD